VIEVIFIIFQKNKKSKVEQNQENAIQSIVKQNNNEIIEECIRRLKFEMQNNFYKINQEITDLRYLKERKTSI
jgi:gas vesicle protein